MKITENPTTSDTIEFVLTTTNAQGCPSDPYRIDRIAIYYVERDFSGGNPIQYDKLSGGNPDKIKAAGIAEALACATPTADNLAAAKRARDEANSSSSTVSFFYNEAKPVLVVGTETSPAWLFNDDIEALVVQVPFDAVGNRLFGNFVYTWQPKGMREGDYFICWTWTPLAVGESFSSHVPFYLAGDTQTTTSIPTHYTDPDKYPTILERYTPEMFKMVVSDDDRTPDVLDKFNGAVAAGFGTLEDLCNQIVDLQDANSIHEALIPYLSNFFGLKLKTSDPTRWRGQIKRAVPLYKMKGTKAGLYEAMEHAAIRVVSLTQLWQVISPHTWQEAFAYEGGDQQFTLSKTALPLDHDNFHLSIRTEDSRVWIPLSSDYVQFSTSGGTTIMYWVGGTLSVNPIDLVEGDEILVLYKYSDIANLTDQTIENYLRSLPLSDLRDDRDQVYPLKNWNVRVIAEADPLFSLIVPHRHPFAEPLVYGTIRTEFPYSENIYNMEEYNGSSRKSRLPCDIDRVFVDPCSACISSSYAIDLEIENLCDDRIAEAAEVLSEFTPFHAVMHSINYRGGVNEFVQSPVEQLEILMVFAVSDFVLAGEAQSWFNRAMKLVETKGILRSQLAASSIAFPMTAGIAYNDEIVVFCQDEKFDEIGMSLDGNASLKILSSPLAGTYALSNPRGNVAAVSPIPGSEPIADTNVLFANDFLNGAAFVFDVVNAVLDGQSLCSVNRDDLFYLSDTARNFGQVKAQFDESQGNYLETWQISFDDYGGGKIELFDVMPDGRLVFGDPYVALPASSGSIRYSVFDDNGILKFQGTGVLTSSPRGRVTVANSQYQPISEVIADTKSFNFIIGGAEYAIVGFPVNTIDQFYIAGYAGLDVGGANLKVERKLVSGKIGYLSHRGLKLKLPGNLESGLGIQNGANSLVVADQGVENGGFRENFLVAIGSDRYFISQIAGNSPSGSTTITLSGTDHYWKTLAGGGTSVNATIYNYAKQGATIDGQQFDLPSHTFRTLDRSGRSVLNGNESAGGVVALSLPDDSVTEYVEHREGISFLIQYADGSEQEGTI